MFDLNGCTYCAFQRHCLYTKSNKTGLWKQTLSKTDIKVGSHVKASDHSVINCVNFARWFNSVWHVIILRQTLF